jgi:anti-sigma regulatory factor (Ser/Thr protein kinase)
MLRVKLSVPYTRAALDALQTQVRAEAAQVGISAKIIGSLIYAIEEIGSNILVHSGATWFETCFEPQAPGGRLTFDDNGEEFDPLEASDLMDEPVISEHVSGHLGLWTLKRLPFKMTWHRQNNVNHLTITVVEL